MALNATTLKNGIISTLEGQGFVFDGVSQADKLVEAIATAVVDHIKTSGQVNVSGTITGTSPAGPVTGSCAAAGGIL